MVVMSKKLFKLLAVSELSNFSKNMQPKWMSIWEQSFNSLPSNHNSARSLTSY